MSARDLAVKALRVVTRVDPDTVVMAHANTGTVVTAKELATVCAAVITDTCPSCGSTPWVNIDCELCMTCAALTDDSPEPKRVTH